MSELNSCKTKYPLLLIHGMGFRDRKRLNYWGRISKYLTKNGAQIYYGCQDSNASIENNAAFIARKIEKILKESNAEKLNIIAHSKGGLEARYMISTLGMDKQIASLSTVNTPHNGSITLDKLLKAPTFIIRIVGGITDIIMKILGDDNPETAKVFFQFTTDYAQKFNEQNPDNPNVFYQSFGFAMKNAFSDSLMSIPYLIVRHFEGSNDGLLSERAVRWTNFKGSYISVSNRGISHCDEVDLRRRKFTSKKSDDPYEISDIVDFYIELVKGLKEKGF